MTLFHLKKLKTQDWYEIEKLLVTKVEYHFLKIWNISHVISFLFDGKLKMTL